MRTPDRVKENANADVVGNAHCVIGGAVAGFRTFASVFNYGEWFDYCILADTYAVWEIGRGYLSTATRFERIEVYYSSIGEGQRLNFPSTAMKAFPIFSGHQATRVRTRGQSLSSWYAMA